ncbi:MAG: HAMP domain-containing sensor histidine kinase [Actinomyces sp.]|nr:HAMP domain-containing sensor histidine kinase [Actinomyces sp.]
MGRRAAKMILAAVTVVVLLMGIPGATIGSIMAWQSEQNALDARVESLMRASDRRISEGTQISEHLVEAWATPLIVEEADAWTRVKARGQDEIVVGETISGPKLRSSESSSLGTIVTMETSAMPAIRRVIGVIVLFIGGAALSMLVGWALAKRLSRRLSAPLIYLAAQAEQIGAGMVRARVKPSGIEEIDLVQDELARTAERMAGRLAAERRFSADASHQLRTPLTALSMRLEEIEMIAEQDEVREEASSCLEQVERLTTVVTDLLDTSKRTSGHTEAIHVVEIFNTAREEWESAFTQAGRTLTFTDESGASVLADAAKLGQVLATLIENSLRYGAGETRVVARKSPTKRGVMIDVSDEGEGVSEELAPEIFDYGVSGHGSSGIGLGLAHDLTEAMGGRLELTQAAPPVFTVSLAAIPASIDPDRVMPQGPLVSMGRRSRRF